MDLLANIAGVLPVVGEESGGGSFLVQPGAGLMIWTLLAFGVTMLILSKLALPKIGAALEERANRVSAEIEAAEKQRAEAEELLVEYRARLKEAREQADDITARARKAAELSEAGGADAGRQRGEEIVAAAKREAEAATRRAVEDLRKEMATLTLLATEKVTRKSLTTEDHKQLVEQALAEVDFSAISGGES